MSHSVTIRTTTTTTGTSSIIVNTGYCTTFRGFLKVLELVLGIVCVGIMGNYFERMSHTYGFTAYSFFLLMTTTFMIGTFLLLISFFISIPTESIISKTIYEVIYHAVAFGLLLAASLNLLIKVTDYYNRGPYYEAFLAAAICGLVNCACYFFSTVFALRLYRGL